MQYRSVIFVISYVIFVTIPGFVFLSARGGFTFLSGLQGKEEIGLVLFPLAGLYAFFLVWAQIMIGSNMRWLRPRLPWIERFHRVEGVAALLFALTHPLLIVAGYGITDYLNYAFVDPSQKVFVVIGQIQLALMLVTICAALLARLPWLASRWIYIHRANYLVFALIWVHSWFLGTDVQATSLRYVWIFFALTAALSFLARLAHARKRARMYGKEPDAQGMPGGLQTTTKEFIRVASYAELAEGTLYCRELYGQKLTVVRLGKECYVFQNTCTHAGGPLCEGKLIGNAVECPWHRSQFDLRSGEVVKGPARNAIRSYPVRIRGDAVEVAIE